MTTKGAPEDTSAAATTPLPDAQAARKLYGDHLQPGALVGPYVVEKLASEGGFACIYRAHHGATGREAAVKVLHQALADTTVILKRFRQEAEAVNRLRHPSIVEIFEVGELRDLRPWIAMEWLEGRDLAAELRARGPLTAAEALAVMEELCGALAVAHAQGIVHRDIKAQNVIAMPGEGGGFRVKLVDFGIVKLMDPEREGAGLTKSGETVGTPLTMSPEQIVGRGVDSRTDVYALGLLLYQLVTGRLPFQAATATEVYDMHLRALPPRPSEKAPVTAAFDEVVLRCLEKEKDKRFAAVADLAAALRAAVTVTPPAAAPARAAATALHVEARLPADAGDDLLDEVDAALAHARAACAAAGMVVAMDAGTALLALRLPPAPAEVLALAEELFASCPHLAVTITGGTVILRDGKPVGGELLALGDWLEPGQPPGVRQVGAG